jgi:hypothetical protein
MESPNDVDMPMAGAPMAGAPVAGAPMAGAPMAGAPMAGAVAAEPCMEIGECEDGEINYPETSQKEGGLVKALAVTDEHDHPLKKYQVWHPVRVHFTFKTEAGSHHDQVLVGLVEKHAVGDDHADLKTCRLGEFSVDYFRRDLDDDGEPDDYKVTQDFIIPDDCLPSGDGERTYNLWVSINPAKDDHPDVMALGGVAPGDYNTQFFNAEAIDTEGEGRNDNCIGPDGEAGCIIDVTVEPSKGDDLKLTTVAYETSVFVVANECAVDYGQPDFEVSTTLLMHGSASYDGETPEEMPENILDSNAHLEYSICPRATTSDSEGCAEGTAYKALAVSGHGAIDAGADRSPNAPVAQMYADTPHIQTHDLHVDPASALCTDLNGGGWKDYHLFNLKSCVVYGDDETGPCGTDNEHCSETRHANNNCRIVPVAMIRIPPEAGNGNSYDANYTWNKSGGSSVVGGSATFETVNRLDLSGATTHNLAQLSVTGWAPFDIFRLWLDAQAYVSLVGSGIDTGITVLGDTLWSYTESVEEVDYSPDTPSYEKSACLHYNFGIAGIGLNVDLCANANAGLDINAKVSAVEGDSNQFANSTRVGDVTVTVEPNASVGLSASASLNVLVARGGLTGNLDIITVNVPAVANLQWGLVDATDATCNQGPCLKTVGTATVDLVVNFLSGAISVWVDLIKPNWCSCGSWCPGYPCAEWARVVNQTLLSFTAYTLNQNLYNQSATLTLE